MQPIIGIVSQPLDESFLDDPRFAGSDSYMMSAYVKFMEASGARVIPLIWNEPDEIWGEKLSKINGVLFPGGDSDYLEYGRKIMDRLIQYNDEGNYFPAWGTCLGFENMLIWASDRGRDILEVYNAHAVSLTLDFVVDPVFTKMFSPMGQGLDAWKFYRAPMTLNSHTYSANPESFVTDISLSEFYKLTSVSYEPSTGKPFAATIEAHNYPFAGT